MCRRAITRGGGILGVPVRLCRAPRLPGPLARITATPQRPGAEDSAKMVSPVPARATAELRGRAHLREGWVGSLGAPLSGRRAGGDPRAASPGVCCAQVFPFPGTPSPAIPSPRGPISFQLPHSRTPPSHSPPRGCPLVPPVPPVLVSLVSPSPAPRRPHGPAQRHRCPQPGPAHPRPPLDNPPRGRDRGLNPASDWLITAMATPPPQRSLPLAHAIGQ